MTEKTTTSIELPDEPIALNQIAARVFDTPLLIHEPKLAQILHVLGPRLGFEAELLDGVLAHESPEAHEEKREKLAQAGRVRAVWNDDGYYNVGAAAVIPAVGSLVQRSSFLGAMSGLVSYARIERAFAAALEDDAAHEILFEIDSPGGEVAGALDLADRIFEARGEKPTTAIATEFAASAAYLIASAADDVVIPRTGYVGSVGVVAAHVDRSQAAKKAGIAVTYIYAGDKKVDGNPYEPLPERVRAEWESEIREIYGLFTSTVARNRGISEQAVRDTEAGLYLGRAALGVGFADRVNTFGNEVHNAAVRRGGAFRLSSTSEDTSMSDKERADQQKAIAEAREEGIAQGKTEQKAESDKAAADAVAKATADERTRIQTIVSSEAAAKRSELAAHLAFNTDMSAEDAEALLEKSPEGATSKSQLAAAMEQHGTPGIRSESTDEEQGAGSPKSDSPSILQRMKARHTGALGYGS